MVGYHFGRGDGSGASVQNNSPAGGRRLGSASKQRAIMPPTCMAVWQRINQPTDKRQKKVGADTANVAINNEWRHVRREGSRLAVAIVGQPVRRVSRRRCRCPPTAVLNGRAAARKTGS